MLAGDCGTGAQQDGRWIGDGVPLRTICHTTCGRLHVAVVCSPPLAMPTAGPNIQRDGLDVPPSPRERIGEFTNRLVNRR